jgi:gliding motility-associated-like protein
MDYFVSDSFCKQLDTFRVTVKKIEPRYILPNAFSPNGDGNNDLFRVILESGLSVEYFRIYNRWGELVFIEQGTSKGWDGKYKEVDQPVGAYIYYITVRNLSTGKIKSSSGNVTLLR